MQQFNKIKLSNKILDDWIAADLNVCLIGKHGVGKSTIILDAFQRHGLKYKYFSGATLDPWVDVVGIPTVKHVGEKSYIDFILPKDLDEDLEAIFIDEYNRSRPAVRSACMELVQFKSINGRKFPKLRFVWIAINPTTDNDVYNVDEVDPAQLDRFHVIAELHDEPDAQYFNKKYPEKAKAALEWYKAQSKQALEFLSPRRLDYILDAAEKGINFKYLLPISANATDLDKLLNRDDRQIEFESLLKEKDWVKMGAFLSDQNNFARFSHFAPKHGYNMLSHVNREILDNYELSNPAFKMFRKTTEPEGVYFKTVTPTEQELLSQVKEFKNNNLILYHTTGMLDNALSFYNDISRISLTQSKKSLYKQYFACLHLFNDEHFDVQKFSAFLTNLGQCQQNTISKLPNIENFLQFAGHILTLARKKEKSYGNLSKMYTQYV